MKEIERASKEINLAEAEKKASSKELVDMCNRNGIDKLIYDDEMEELLSATRVVTKKKSWDDKAIQKTLSKKQLASIVKKKVVEIIDYEQLLVMAEEGDITEEQLNTMFKESETEYIKVMRVKR